jgi:general secretion pathway protein C
MLTMCTTSLLVLGLVASPTTPTTQTQNPTLLVQGTTKKPHKVLLNFDQADLVDVVKSMSTMTGKNFIVEDRIRTRRLTIISASRVTVDEAYQAFVEALKAEGFEIEQKGKFYRVQSGNTFLSRRSPVKSDCPAFDDIKKFDEATWSIPAGTLDKFLESSSCMVTQARIVPSMKDGKVDGFKLYGIRKESIYSKVGIRNGDVVHKINGYEFTSPEKALEIYTQLKDAKTILIELTRRGKPMKFTYRVE